MEMNQLYYGDCLTVIEKDIDPESVDLIYLDPPFNSNRAYNAIYKDETGRPLPDQIEAFCDLWTLDEERERAIRNLPDLMIDKGIDHRVVKFWESWMDALRYTNPRMLAYLSYMVERLVWMKDILKPTGSIYLHCDPTASHYIKVMMDGVFGHENFRNEIIWCYERGGRSKSQFGRKHDTLLFYSKTQKYVFYADAVRINRRKTHMKIETDSEGGEWQVKKDAKSGKIYRYPADMGVLCPDWWTGIQQLNRNEKERLGYPTQKPLTLLERIIRASSNEGDVVLDPFCGCATTLEAAEKLNRNWMGIDIAIHAINRVTAIRLKDRCGLIEGEHYQITGIPQTLEGAIDLWERDRYHFQKWAVEEVEGFVTTRRSADGGIDGRLYFSVPDERDLQSMILEVKGGANVTINALRALRGVLEQDDALLAGLIVMNSLGDRQARNFRQFMAEAGDLRVDDTLYPRLQMLSIPELLDGKRFKTPTVKARGSGQILIAL
jgi:site-specific DNA-methyltransferase (adenine-specific)